MRPALIDSNVLIDIATDDVRWGSWSAATLDRLAEQTILVINPIVYTELAVGYRTIEQLDAALPADLFRREDLPWEAAFLAGRCHAAYRQRGGVRPTPLPDFLIGAHAAIADYRLVTRDATVYRSSFPTLLLIAPDQAAIRKPGAAAS